MRLLLGLQCAATGSESWLQKGAVIHRRGRRLNPRKFMEIHRGKLQRIRGNYSVYSRSLRRWE